MADEINFPIGCVPLKVAATVMGMDIDVLKSGMEAGDLDLGYIHRTPRKRGRKPYRRFYIMPKKLYELSGFMWEGEQTALEVRERMKHEK